MYLSEAFKQLSILNEDVFDIDDKGIEELDELVNDTDEEVIDVIDIEASDMDELQDNYIGKVVLDCNVCHSKIFEDADKIVIDETADNVNEEMECPYCYSNAGYKIVGEIKEYSDSKEVEDEEESTEEVKEDETEETVIEEDTDRSSMSVAQAQKWVDYDMKRYGEISKLTNEKIKKAGLEIVKDDHGDYVVTAKESDGELTEGIFGNKYKKYKVLVVQTKNNPDVWQSVAMSKDDDVLQNYRLSYKPIDRKDSVKAAHIMTYDEAKRYIEDGKEPWEDAEILDEELKESIEQMSFETKDTAVSMTSDESGKVTVVAEPKEVVEGEEVIGELTDETAEEIVDANTEDEEVSVEDEVEVDEFVEESFNRLGEGYLKKVYNNVKSFATTDVRGGNSKLVVEGVITFNSGKQKKTTFAFESTQRTKSGKFKFLGENVQITKGKRAFSLTGKISGNKFLPESFNYNYKAKDVNGNSKRLYGTIKVGE